MSAKGTHNPRRTVFFHTPKAAGTTVLKVIEPTYRLGHGPYAASRESFERNKREGDTWESVFKFTFVRNPWDRMVSLFFHMSGATQWQSGVPQAEHFQRWLSYDGVVAMQTQSGANAFCDHGPQVDFIGQFEHLRRDLERLALKIQRPLAALQRGELPIENPGIMRPDHRWEPYYDETSRNIVAAFHRFEIKKFGYRFADPSSRAAKPLDVRVRMV